jgi:hypothetical protein
MWQNIQRNWKTNLVSLIAFIYTIPQAVVCIQEWINNQPCNWRSAVLGLLLGLGAAAAKDSDNHSNVTEVNKATKEDEVNNPLPQQAWKPFPDKKK